MNCKIPSTQWFGQSEFVESNLILVRVSVVGSVTRSAYFHSDSPRFRCLEIVVEFVFTGSVLDINW